MTLIASIWPSRSLIGSRLASTVPRYGCGIFRRSSNLAAGDAEQITDRARVPEGDQRRVDAVLEHRAMLDQCI
jgi:hypothetical protein